MKFGQIQLVNGYVNNLISGLVDLNDKKIVYLIKQGDTFLQIPGNSGPKLQFRGITVFMNS